MVLRSTSGTHTPFPKPDSRPLDEWQRVSLEGNGGLVDGERGENWKALCHRMGRKKEQSEAGTDAIDSGFDPR